MPIDKKLKRRINFIVQAIIIVILALFLYSKLDNKDLIASISKLCSSFLENKGWWIFIFLLMPLNWFLEAVKWKLLCKPVLRISLVQSIQGVLSGLSISFVTPHGWGDYLGRIGSLTSDQRDRLIGGLFFGKMVQLFFTIIAGILGLVLFLEVYPYLYLWYIICLLLISLLIGFNKTFYKKVRPYLFKIRRFFSIIKMYNASDILNIMIYSCARYLVFTLQFLLILLLFKIDLSPLFLLGGITWIFLIKSIVPSFNFLSDLGIREVSAVMFFQNQMADVSPVISGTLIIWLINICVPATIGILFIFSTKLFR